jgi:pimeloyl-ACP methyl ester carboxylesterase
MPCLVLDGGRAEAHFRRVADGLAAAIPGVRRVTLPGAAHLLNWDDVESFNAAVVDFLRDA